MLHAIGAMAEQDCARRRAPASRAVVSGVDGLLVLGTRCERAIGREQETSGRENIAPVSLDGPLRPTLLLALMQTPHRFRSRRQL